MVVLSHFNIQIQRRESDLLGIATITIDLAFAGRHAVVFAWPAKLVWEAGLGQTQICED